MLRFWEFSPRLIAKPNLRHPPNKKANSGTLSINLIHRCDKTGACHMTSVVGQQKKPFNGITAK